MGDHEGALAACKGLLDLPSPEGARCRLVAAAVARARGEHAAVEGLLVPALPRLGTLEPWARLLLAESMAAAGNLDSARSLARKASSVDPEGPLGKRAAALEARLALEGPAEAGEELLRRLHRDEPKIALALGRRLLASGKKGEGAEILRRLWRDHPEGEEAREAASALEEAGIAPSWDDRLERSRRLLSMGDAEAAILALEGQAPPSHRGRIALLRAKAHSDAGARDTAEQVLTDALPHLAAAERVEAWTLLGRLAARRGSLEEAVAHLDRAASTEGRGAAEAAFLASFLFYDFGRFDQAAERFEAYGAQHQARREEASWFRGWSLYLQGKGDEAEKVFASHLATWPKGATTPQILYWRARLLEKAGKGEEAKALYARGARLWPTDWYGLLSSRRVGAAPAAPTTRAAPPAGPWGKGAAWQRLGRAKALYEVGFSEEAGEELDAAVRSGAGKGLLLAGARLALEHGDPARAFRLSSRLGGPASASDLSFPLAFPREMERAGAAGIDPLLVLSVIRQESGFSRTARSPRGAVGLMQLLPGTARKLVSYLDLSVDPELLTDPATNVVLGAAYLSALLDRFGGNEALAVAAYNAGPEAVVRWLEDPLRSGLSLDEWVEAIPWRETRGYVKTVLSNYATYRALASKPPPLLQEALPKVRDGIDF